MSINDSKKIIIVNVDKIDFTDTESIRNNAQHESVHNRYVDGNIDEIAAGTIYDGRDDRVNNKVPDNLVGLLNQGKEIYDYGVENGEIRGKDCVYSSYAQCIPKDEAQRTIERYNNMKVGRDLSGASFVLDFIPVVGDVKGIIEGVKGEDLLTKEELSLLERALGFVFLGEVKGITRKTLKSIKVMKNTNKVVIQGVNGTKVVLNNSDIVKSTIKNSSGVASVTNNTLKISAGKNFKDHFIRHKNLLEKVTGNKYSSYKEPQKFLGDIEKLIQNGTVKYTGKGTLNKGSDVMNIYRGKGVTIVTKADGEWVTILETGKGMDLNIKFK